MPPETFEVQVMLDAVGAPAHDTVKAEAALANAVNPIESASAALPIRSAAR